MRATNVRFRLDGCILGETVRDEQRLERHVSSFIQIQRLATTQIGILFPILIDVETPPHTASLIAQEEDYCAGTEQ
ncbi:hypothetical protein PsorP6_001482 [Peronosclerospora sorghi]|uniref:Uncharacterized protein n=1 Tax=Peronosclerospora sorghi TaxID=230839 RepID=A0ACC0WYE3_9STRA|nr:hypothetical protein PsorP6_001482 [Peronosclerospora sorghi]